MISILLPFRNAGKTITATLSSIAVQTYPYFEVIAIDDHSSDSSRQHVINFPDSRIRCFQNSGRGLVDALNFGIEKCRYPYIARMDGDDLMRKDRLQQQLDHFRQNPALSLSATRASLFAETPIQAGYIAYMTWQNDVLSHHQISEQIYVESPFAHPSVMFKRSAVTQLGGYRSGDFPEDYDLWLRFFQNGYQMEKLPHTLLDWREYPHRTSRTHPCYRREAFDRLRADYLANDSRLPSDRPIGFWGAGRKTRKRIQHLIDKGVKPSAWIDIDPKKIGNRVDGASVYPPSWLREYREKLFILIYVANHGAREEIAAELESIGYRCGEDYLAVG